MSYDAIKYRDYAKHISWVYRKTQVLPKVLLMGKNSETVPIKDYKLRTCELTRLDAGADAPAPNDLFIDHLQAKLFYDIRTEDIRNDAKIARKYIGQQNVVILDDYDTVCNVEKLIATVELGEIFLAHHGRLLFDIPILSSWDHIPGAGLLESIERLGLDIKQFPNDVDMAVSRIMNVAKITNQKMAEEGSHAYFVIEDIKLSIDESTHTIVGARTYFKEESTEQ